MSKEIIVHGPMQASNQIFPDKKVPIYTIYIERDYNRLLEILEKMEVSNHKIMILSDSNVSKFHLSDVMSIVKTYTNNAYSYIIEAGEEQKHLDTVADIYEQLILKQFDRSDFLIALGGGVIGDITGYVAATYLRGIRFIQMPTSLLAMVDSSIGGKTGVDFRSYKNMVGAFHQPQAVYINLSVLTTLPNREFNSGFGEIIKHGLIKNKDYFIELQENVTQILNRDSNLLEEIIYQSCLVKQNVVENDPTEKGERALLNFGHTIGHAVEKYMNFSLLHGECVAIGMVAAAYMSYRRAAISREAFEKILTLIKAYQLPTAITLDETSEEIMISDALSIVKHDKKMISGQIRFVLLKEVGNAYIDKTVQDDEIKQAISFIIGGNK